jgi:Ca2+-binding RTX toxin-like protein
LQASYDALVAPVTGDDGALATTADAKQGSAGNDAFTATELTYGATDVILDAYTNDADVLTLTLTDEVDVAATVSGIETVNVNLDAFGTSNGNTDELEFELSGYSLVNNVSFDVTRDGSTVDSLDVDNMKSGMTVTFSDDFTDTVNIGAADNAAITIVSNADTLTGGAGITISGATVDSVTLTGNDDTLVAGSSNDGAFTANVTGDANITAATATTGTVTASGSATVDMAAATTLTVTAGDEAVVTTEAATALTLSASGTTTDTTVSETTDGDLVTLNVSGNGGALDVDTNGAEAIATVNVSGDQDVRVIMHANDINGLTSSQVTFADTSTATSTLEIAGTAAAIDLTNAAADLIDVSIDLATTTMTVASGANVSFTEDQDAGGGTTISAAAATATTNTVNVTIADDGAALTSDDPAALAFTNMATVNLTLADTSAGHTVTALDAGTAAVNVTGNDLATTFATSITGGALTITNGAAVSFGTSALAVSSINASAVTGAVDMDLDGDAVDPSSVTTGSGADTLTVETTVADYTLATNAGDDTVEIDVAVTTANTVTVDGGDGSDTVEVATGLDIRGVSMSSVETLSLLGTATMSGTQMDGATFVVKGSGSAVNTSTISLDSTSIDLSDLTIVSAGAQSFGGSFTTDATGYTGLALTLTGSSVADTMTGGDKNDTITGNAGDDTLSGGAGSDTISGDAGADSITGGSGADVMSGGAGVDTFYTIDGTAEVQTLQVTTTATAADVDTITILGRDVTSTSVLGTINGTATEYAAAINGDAVLGDLVTATASTDTVTITYHVDGDVGAVALTAGNTAVATIATTTAGAIGTAAATDSVTAGEGADIILSGAGNDTIDLTETTSAVDTIYLSAAANNGVDTVTGFTVGTDNIIIDASDVTHSAGVHASISVALVTGGATYTLGNDTTTTSVIEIATTLDDDVTLSATSDGDDLMQALSSDATAAASITLDTAGEDFYIAAYQNGNAYLFSAIEADGAVTVEADEITLVAVLEGVTAGSLVAGDFI